MRILLVIPSITNYFTFLDELTEVLMQQGHSVALAASPSHFQAVDCYEKKPRCAFFPIELPQGMNPVLHFRAANELRRIIRDFVPDIVHCHTGAGIFTTSLVAFMGGVETRFIATHHGMVYPLIDGFRRYLIGPAERWALRQLDSVHLLNRDDRDELASKGMKQGIFLYQKSKGIGCRINQFDRNFVSPKVQAEIRAQYGIAEQDFVFIYVGRQVWFKGFDLTIRAFLEVNRRFPQSKLLLLGEPYKVHPTGLTEEEQAIVKNHPAIKKVGWVKEVEHFLGVSKVNVFPSEREGMPVNLMESICMGVPVITRNSRGCNEIVEDGRSGWLLQHRDLGELIEKMERCILQPDELQKMISYCLEIRGRFDRNLWIREQISYYHELIGHERENGI